MAAPDRGTVPISYCLYAGLSQLSLPPFSQERSGVIYLRYHRSNKEEEITAVPTKTRSPPGSPHSAQRRALGSCRAAGTTDALPARSGTAPRACARSGSGVRAREAASPSEPPALSVPGAWRSPARPGSPSRWGRGEPESGRVWGREPSRERPGVLRPCRGRAGPGRGRLESRGDAVRSRQTCGCPRRLGAELRSWLQGSTDVR